MCKWQLAEHASRHMRCACQRHEVQGRRDSLSLGRLETMAACMPPCRPARLPSNSSRTSLPLHRRPHRKKSRQISSKTTQ